jgi:broad specificity phosphatase PhoE
MLRLLLIRHGQTDWNADRRWQGHADVPLNEVGKAQARALAERLDGWQLNAMYSSDLKRAAMTAEILGRSLNLKPIHNPAWRERNVGFFAGLTNDEVQQAYPEAWHEMQRGVVNPPGGEHFLELYERVVGAYEQLLHQHAEGTVAVVSHGGALHALISHVLGIGAVGYGRFSLSGNTGLSIVEIGERGQRLILLNDTCHLDHGLGK